MAKLEVSGIYDLNKDFDALVALSDSLINDILNAEADVIVQAQQSEIKKQWSGPYSVGISAKSVKKGKMKFEKRVHTLDVYPSGTRTRGKSKTRNAEIAFINEYGSSGAGRKKDHKKRTAPKRVPPRPAIRTANAKAEGAAVEAGEKAYHAYLDSKNL